MLVHECVELAALNTPNALALADERTRWTFGQLRQAVEGWRAQAEVMASPGARILIAAPARAEVVAALYGLPAAGRVAVPVNTRLRNVDVMALVEDVAPEGLIGSGPLFDDLRQRLGVPAVELDRPGSVPGRASRSPGGEQPAPDTTAWIMHTSGTTGVPKGVMLTHRSLMAAVANTAVGRPLASDDVVGFPFPLFHVAAYNVVHAHLRRRPVILPGPFDSSRILNLVAAEAITTMSVAPTMVAMMLEAATRLAQPVALRSLSYGSAPMPPDLIEGAVATFGCRLAQGYGMTELSGNALFLPHKAHRAGLDGEDRFLRAAGYPGPLVAVRLGAGGELQVRGPQVFPGYWNRRDLTAEALTSDGWLRTGDIARLDDDGLVTIVDRAKDLVITGGENVAARDVEEVIRAHPAVAEVAVIGTPHPRWVEQVTAVVVLAVDARSGAGARDRPHDHAAGSNDDVVSALDEWLRDRLAGYKRPRRYERVEALPTTATGKVDKAALRRRFAASRGSEE